jgi:hypothetical protein
MKKHISAVLRSLTACSQSVEVDEAGSNHSDAIATADSTTAMDAGDASADGTSRTTDSAMDVSPSESDAMISQSDASAPVQRHRSACVRTGNGQLQHGRHGRVRDQPRHGQQLRCVQPGVARSGRKSRKRLRNGRSVADS